MNPANPSPTLPEHWAAKFLTIWVGQAFSLVGSSLVQFALVWWLTQKTGSATILATATLVSLLPQIVLGPFVGTLVDRWNRRLIMITADSGIALATLVLIFLFASGQVQVWHVLAINFIRSLGGAFHQPAMAASTSLMVPNKHLARVAGLNQTLQGVVTIFAPPLGAFLISVLPTYNVLMIDIATAALAVFPLFFIPIPQPPRQAAAVAGNTQQPSYWHDLRDGFRYVIRWPGLSAVILLAMMLNFLLSPIASLLPLLVSKEFHGQAPELAAVEALFGAGIIAGGLILGIWGGFRRRIVTTLCGIIGIGVGVILMGLTPAQWFGVLLGANFMLGFTQVFANGPLNAIFQSAVAPDYQGRVFSLIGAGAMAMMPLSLLVAGPLADALGVRFWYVLGGSICILITLLAFSFPPLMKIEQNRVATEVIVPTADVE